MSKETMSLQTQCNALEKEMYANIKDCLDTRKLRNQLAEMLLVLYSADGVNPTIAEERVLNAEDKWIKDAKLAGRQVKASRIELDTILTTIDRIKVAIDYFVLKSLNGSRSVLTPDDEGFDSYNEELSRELSNFRWDYKLKYGKVPFKISKSLYEENQS